MTDLKTDVGRLRGRAWSLRRHAAHDFVTETCREGGRKQMRDAAHDIEEAADEIERLRELTTVPMTAAWWEKRDRLLAGAAPSSSPASTLPNETAATIGRCDTCGKRHDCGNGGASPASTSDLDALIAGMEERVERAKHHPAWDSAAQAYAIDIPRLISLARRLQQEREVATA